MERKTVYLLRDSKNEAYVATVIAPQANEASVLKSWLEVVKRAEAKQVLDPELFPDLVSVYSGALEELQAKHPDWQITFAYFVRVNSIGSRTKIGERNLGQ